MREPREDPPDLVARMVRRLRMTPQERKREWEEERAAVAAHLGIVIEQADDLLAALPYSSIPDWHDVLAVADAYSIVRRSDDA